MQGKITLTIVTQYREIFEDIIGLCALQKEGDCAKNSSVQVVYNESCRDGASYSIRAALNALGEIPAEDYLLFVVADQPLLSAESIRKMLQAADGSLETACISCHGKTGNPVLFSASLIPELYMLEKDQGGRKVMKQHDCRWIPVENEQELWDVDTLDDVLQFRHAST